MRLPCIDSAVTTVRGVGPCALELMKLSGPPWPLYDTCCVQQNNWRVMDLFTVHIPLSSFQLRLCFVQIQAGVFNACRKILSQTQVGRPDKYCLLIGDQATKCPPLVSAPQSARAYPDNNMARSMVNGGGHRLESIRVCYDRDSTFCLNRLRNEGASSFQKSSKFISFM